MTVNGQSDRGEVVGFVDLGTNAVRLLVAELHPAGTYTVLSIQREQIRLGEGEFATGRLTQAAIDRAVTVVTRFAALARSLGAGRIVAAATSATREADNRGVLVRRLESEAGVTLRVVSGREEARLILEAVRHRVGLDERPVLVIDIGGGSTEVGVGDADRDLYLDSLKLGALRLAADRFGLDREEPVGGEDYRELKRAIEVTSVYAAQEVRSLAPVAAYGTSGTIRNLVAVAARAVRGEEIGDPTTATLPELRKAAKLLRGLPLSQRRAVPGLAPERADVVVAGAAVLETLLDACGVTEIRAVEQCGLREGLLFEEIQSRGDGGTVHRRAVRERSVAGLARAARVDERHAAKVRELALQLFDSAARAGLHRLGEGERELLGFAATLHDAGASVSYTDHHVHSAYLIRNSDLLGFDQAEIDLMATVALLHRKAMAAGRYPRHPQLGRRAARTARTLAVLLRIGELLDRGHEGAVAEARLARAGRDAVRLEIVPAGDCRLEEWGLEARRRALEKGLGHRLEIVVLGDGSAAGATAAGGAGASAAAAARTAARKRPA